MYYYMCIKPNASKTNMQCPLVVPGINASGSVC